MPHFFLVGKETASRASTGLDFRSLTLLRRAASTSSMIIRKKARPMAALRSTLGVFFVGLCLPGPTVAQASLVLLDSIRLEQTSDVFLALPAAVEPDKTGYLVVDAQQPQVFRFGRNGQLTRTYGREGEGPGEFKEAAAAVPFGEEKVLIFSWSPAVAQSFDRSTGGFLERFRIDGPVEKVLLDSDGVWVSGIRYSSRTGLRRFVLGEDRQEYLVSLPAEFVEKGPLGGIFPVVSFALWADTVVVGFEPLNELFLFTRDGTALDTLEVPVRQRRGVPDDPTEALLEAMRRGPYSEVFGVLSRLVAVHRQRDGSIVLVHLDSRPEGPPVTSEAFVTILAPDRQSACVDAVLPLGPAAQPALGFEEDHLLVLEQVLVGLEAVPVLRKFRIDTSVCTWTRLGS
jgi:hypothetical protein